MKRPIRVEGNIAFVPLTRGYEAVIDANDVALVDGHNWHADVCLRSDGSVRAVYAMKAVWVNGKKSKIGMHRIILQAPTGLYADHIDGDGLNNRRGNLRVATSEQNQHNRRLSISNSSGFKGVCWNKSVGKWQAQMRHNGATKYIGVFDSVNDAARAYAAEVTELRGEFARLK